MDQVSLDTMPEILMKNYLSEARKESWFFFKDWWMDEYKKENIKNSSMVVCLRSL